MSQPKTPYATDNSPDIKPGALLRYTDDGYQPPDFADIRALKERSDKTGNELANLIGVNARQFRRWTAPPDAANASTMPYAAWRLLLIELEVLEKK